MIYKLTYNNLDHITAQFIKENSYIHRTTNLGTVEYLLNN